jgi:hypothetical protein
MPKARLCGLIASLCLVALALPSAASASFAHDPYQWSGVGNSGNPVRKLADLRPDNTYSLHSNAGQPGGQFLSFGRVITSNLSGLRLDGTARREWRFVRRNTRDHRGLHSGEKVALYNAKHRMYVSSRSNVVTSDAVQLGFTTEPSYSWVVVMKPGGQQALFALTRPGTDATEYLVFNSDVTHGVQLSLDRELPDGPQPCSSGQHDTVGSGGFADAQPAVNGYANYVLTFPAVCAYLTQISNPNAQTIGFLKPGKTAADCGDPNAVVYANQNTIITNTATFLGGTSEMPASIGICGYGPPQGSLRIFYNYQEH